MRNGMVKIGGKEEEMISFYYSCMVERGTRRGKKRVQNEPDIVSVRRPINIHIRRPDQYQVIQRLVIMGGTIG